MFDSLQAQCDEALLHARVKSKRAAPGRALARRCGQGVGDCEGQLAPCSPRPRPYRQPIPRS
eukprot:588269-Alexandrium_andersonii.AAC.1